MASAFAKFLQQILGKSEMRGLMVGNDASGKTTVLYKLKLGEIVTTIPTIGFNVETVQYKKYNFTLWDVGGCDKIRPLWRHYFQNTQFVFYLIDSNDRDRLEEAAHSFIQLTTEAEMKDAVYVILANKQDLPNAMSVSEITDKMGLNSLRGVSWEIYPTCATSGDGLYEALDGLVNLLEGKKSTKISTTNTTSTEPTTPTTTNTTTTTTTTTTNTTDTKTNNPEKDPKSIDVILESWIERKDLPDDEFMAAFERYDLDSWDHYTHLRIAWLYLKRYGRREGMKRIFKGIRDFIKYSVRARKTTFHETMTYFWVHMVHYAMVSTQNPTKTFKGFLIMNPIFANGGMFLEYYRKDTMLFTMKSRQEVVLPDKKPLPSLLNINTSGKLQPLAFDSIPPDAVEEDKTEIVAKQLSDIEDLDEFVTELSKHSYSNWNHKNLLKLTFMSLKKKERREGSKIVFDTVRTCCKLEQKEIHTTQIMFWIQMVDFHMRSDSNVKDIAELVKSHPELEKPRLFLEYYKIDTILNNPVAAAEFVLPDKKPLPNILNK
eukprot:TRINITY_DN12133_c0_g1_i1.p1 TRINITY_DN12133_c0_g1~~TRINITY_DN12133_c0_g1_i1.p1  ORF type:complete len:545 (+),score=103.73 TRINITY_DN12133_c0_g1_i1:2-1636(+)